MMKKVCDYDNCIGCRACENICPKSAIIMKKDEKGYLKSYIDESVCVNCGLCEEACNYSLKNKNELEREKLIAFSIYGMKNKDNEVRANSSSGGFFYSVAKYVISLGGVVYGCILNDKIEAVFSRAEKIDDIRVMMGSKYIFSDLGDTFVKLSGDLNADRFVLFTGTPCQCWQLRRYLKTKKINDDKVIIVDFLCHGCPSPKVFKSYKDSIERKYNGKIIEFKFRDKEKLKNPPSGRGIRSTIIKNGGEIIDVYGDKLSDRYFELFIRNYISNSSCYECKFVGFNNRAGDITMADYWGCDDSYPDFFDKKGISLVLVNSTVGIEFVKKIKHEFEFIEVEENKCIQTPLKKIPSKPKEYELFWREFKNKGFDRASKKIESSYFLKKKYYEFKRKIKKY